MDLDEFRQTVQETYAEEAAKRGMTLEENRAWLAEDDEEPSIRWLEFEVAIKNHFSEGTSEALDLDYLASTLIDSEDDLDWLETLGLRAILERRGACESLIHFEWDGLIGSGMNVDVVTLDSGTELACVGENPYMGVAILPCGDKQQVYHAFTTKLISTSGEHYGVGLFGGPPSGIANHRSDLLHAETVKESFRMLMEWAVENDRWSWLDLRDQVIAGAEGLTRDRELRRSIAELKGIGPGQITVGEIGEYQDTRAAEAEAISEEERDSILEIYFAQSYREV